MRFRPLINNVLPLAVVCSYACWPSFADGGSRDSKDESISGTPAPADKTLDGQEHQLSCTKLQGRVKLDLDLNLTASQSAASSQAIFNTAAMKAIHGGKPVIAICFLCGSEVDLHKIEFPVVEPDANGAYPSLVQFYPLWICTECLHRDDYFKSDRWLVWYIDENNTVRLKQRPVKSCGCKTGGCSCGTTGYDCGKGHSAKHTTATP